MWSRSDTAQHSLDSSVTRIHRLVVVVVETVEAGLAGKVEDVMHILVQVPLVS